MRKVIVSKYVLEDSHTDKNGMVYKKNVLRPQGEAMFHQFGVDYEEFETGPGNYSTAIVEWPDGQVESVPAQLIRFVTEPTQ